MSAVAGERVDKPFGNATVSGIAILRNRTDRPNVTESKIAGAAALRSSEGCVRMAFD